MPSAYVSTTCVELFQAKPPKEPTKLLTVSGKRMYRSGGTRGGIVVIV